MASFKSLSPGEVQSKTEFSTSQDSCVNIPARISIFFLEAFMSYTYTRWSLEQAGICLAWLCGHRRVESERQSGDSRRKDILRNGAAKGWASLAFFGGPV